MRLFLTLLAVSALTGCATQDTIITAERHHPISVDLVKIYEFQPPESQVVAIITATGRGGGESSKEKVVANLRKKAAGLGANGIVLSLDMLKATTSTYPVKNADGTVTENVPRTEISLAVEAIYVR